MNESHPFDKRIVLVTGISSGIGRSALFELVKRGATVVGVARREKPGREVVEEANSVTEAGGRAEYVKGDIADESSIKQIIDTIYRRYGRLDAAFNNAGIEAEFHMTPDTPTQLFDDVFQTNVRGTWLCMKEELKIMRDQGFGSIVNTSSIAGVVAFPQASVYTASKHAVIGMTKATALEFADTRIRVNCICPGATKSEMSSRWAEKFTGGEEAMAAILPKKRLATPEEMSNAALFLLSDEASYITGAQLAVDGGYSLG